jgi:Domain of unknown function (DUF4349)
MDRFDDEKLFAELREERPTPRPEFTAELDERATAGFPRRSPSSAAAMPFALLADRWRALSPRARLMPVLTVALAALVVATAIVAISQSGSKSNPAENAVVGMVPGAGESGISAEESVSGTSAPASPSREHGVNHGGSNSGGASGEVSSGTVYGTEVPSVESEKGPAITNAPAAGASAGEAGGAEKSGEAKFEAEPEMEAEGTSIAGAPAMVPPPVALPAHTSAGGRDIERSAYIVLGTKPGEVAGAAAKVYEAVHAANGVVLHSSVQSGTAGATGASFSLLIPSRKLDDALATFSSIAEVRQRHDATDDITAPTVNTAEELADSNASIDGLLKELGDVETEAERESVEARLREERRHHAAIRASLEHLDKRASMSEVSLRIVTDHGAGVTLGGSDSGNWSVGDALHDAGHILTIAAGVLLIGLAVLAPIALIALLIWLAARFRLRRLRERTLG